jgi:hypothetical protein
VLLETRRVFNRQLTFQVVARGSSQNVRWSILLRADLERRSRRAAASTSLAADTVEEVIDELRVRLTLVALRAQEDGEDA